MGDGMSLGTSWGDVAALASGIGFAAALVLVRRARRRDMLPATALSGVVLALASLPFARPLALAPGDVAPLFTTGLVILPIAFGAFTIGPRYISAPEVGLLMLLQAVLSPAIVWLVLGEAMTGAGLVGGAIVIGTLAVHSAFGLRAPPTSSESAPRSG
jgi:drug/metabolite transporter (DMT)-like permease